MKKRNQHNMACHGRDNSARAGKYGASVMRSTGFRFAISIPQLLLIVLMVGYGSAALTQGSKVLAQEPEQETPEPQILVRPSIVTGVYDPLSTDEEIILIREITRLQKLQGEINDRVDKIEETNREIEELNLQLQTINEKKESLETELGSLTLTNKRNEAQIRLTEQGIERGKLELQKLNVSIENNSSSLEILQEVLKRNYQRSNEFEHRSLELFLLIDNSFYDVLDIVEETNHFSTVIKDQLSALENETYSLNTSRSEAILERGQLERKQSELEDRKKIYQFSIQAKEQLVNSTKNSEDEYQRLLNEKIGERLELQQELATYESQIEYLRDPDSLPTPKLGLLSFPFEGTPRVTQGFGRTAFSIRNAHRYGRDTHNGLDFGLNIGSKLFASADGVVKGVGNTDLVSTCQAWGKWKVLEHEFGLSTLYAHLSFIKVRVGQKVQTGDLIGYSGNTGFSTGPHLHFGVYDTRGLRIVPYEQISGGGRCRGLLFPVAAEGANIDPGLYLP